MALSRARYDDVVIPYARRTSLLEEVALQDLRRRSSMSAEIRRASLMHSVSRPIPEDDVFKEIEVKEMEEGEEELMQDDFEDLPTPTRPSPVARCSRSFREGGAKLLASVRRPLTIVLGVVLGLLYAAYFAYAMYVERLRNSDSIRLLWVTAAVVFFLGVHLFKKRVKSGPEVCVEMMLGSWRRLNKRTNGRAKTVMIVIGALLSLAGFIAILVELVGKKDPYNLISLLGIFVIIAIGFLGSTNPDRIVWRPVVTGLLLQFLLALFILKTTPGYEVFKFIGDRVTEFLSHTNVGSAFVFDIPKKMMLTNFAFRILPIIIFFSTFISVLYYLGVMQLLISKVAWIMQAVMGTTGGESLNAAGNIFVGMTEAPLMIRPFIGKMTNSELHAVMSGGFATIAGSVLGAYIKFGVPANHLITASVLSAPAALAMSKLIHPETKKSKTKVDDLNKMESSPYNNLVEAAAGGALASIQLVANIAASLIAFLALLEFVNQTLTWFGQRAGMDEALTFQLICSYLLWPLAFVMGVALEDCRLVGELIGVKTFLNEYIAYTELAKLIKNRERFEFLQSTSSLINMTLDTSRRDFFSPELNATFVGGFMQSRRSEAIATYSLCGFSNVGAIGIMLGGLSALAPHRTRDLSQIVVRAMISGNLACFLTACIAGLFYDPAL